MERKSGRESERESERESAKGKERRKDKVLMGQQPPEVNLLYVVGVLARESRAPQVYFVSVSYSIGFPVLQIITPFA